MCPALTVGSSMFTSERFENVFVFVLVWCALTDTKELHGSVFDVDHYKHKHRVYEEPRMRSHHREKAHLSLFASGDRFPTVGSDPPRKNLSSSSNFEILPEFSEPVPNVTAIIGRSVKLPCVVNNLGQYRVAWLRVESKTILTIHESVITRNYRVQLTQSDGRHWELVIKNAQESDRGGYMCQINTVPMLSQIGYLDVLVPPDIVGSQSSSDVLVREGSNVTLVCRAKGYPAPQITWRREDGQPLSVGNWQAAQSTIDNVSYGGEELSIAKVSRLHMGPYLCIASNGVPSPVSRRILLQVHFPPMIWIPNQLIGAPIGGVVTMDCNTEAFPMSINYWTREDGDLISDSAKYSLNRTENLYKVHMSLRIRDVGPEDFGAYRCFAKNSLGSTEGAIRLYEIHVPPPVKVKEPSTARIQSVEDGKLEVAGSDGSTKTQNFPRRPMELDPEDNEETSDSSTIDPHRRWWFLILQGATLLICSGT
ncbi:protein amalgam-like isoform X2 [Ornithodoros turicata]|uniref:protein amalgam-like isoform X2 n=1 Tax=Ornithodoros turicata TaxID=34597 RepID=UPI003139135E